MKIKTNEICLYSILGVLVFSLKFIMSFLPNIEPVSLLLIAYTIVFGIKAIYPMIIYVLLEVVIYGCGFWSIAYIYIWPILLFITFMTLQITNKSMNVLLWSLISAIFGLLFGALYIPLYAISGGVTFAITWWVSGVSFDIVHCISNFILCMVLLKPITKTLLKLKQYKIN